MRWAWLLVFWLGLLPGTTGAAALTDAQTGFSADRVLVIDGRTYRGKVWAMPGKERHEQPLHGLRPAFLLRAGSALGAIVLTNLKTVVQFAVPPELQLLDWPAIKQRPTGRETVGGIATTKYAIDKSIDEGHAAGTLWLSRDGIPMRLAGTFTKANGKVLTVSWELSGVRTGPQPPALFEPPAGWPTLPPEAVAPLIGLKLKSAGR